MKRKARLGDIQNIAIDFPEAKAGDVYSVDVQIQSPDGTIVSHAYTLKFYAPKGDSK